MGNIEQLIYQALSKVDAKDPVRRQEVYKLAWRAYDKAVLSKKNLNDEQRKKIQATFLASAKKVEKEIAQKLQKNLQKEQPISQEQPPLKEAFVDFGTLAPEKSADGSLHEAQKGQAHEQNIPEQEAAFYAKSKKTAQPFESAKKKKLWSYIVLAWLLLALFIAWSFYRSIFYGVDLKSADNSISHPPATVDKIVSSTNLMHNCKGGNWLKVFDPNNQKDIPHVVGGTVKLLQDKGTRYAHAVLSGDKAQIVFSLPKAVIEQFRGKKAAFNLILQEEGKKETEITTLCDFGNGQKSGFSHFQAPSYINNLLFEVSFPQDASDQSKFYLTMDSLKGSASFNIFSILVHPSEEEPAPSDQAQSIPLNEPNGDK